MNMNTSTATTSWLNTKLAAYRAYRAEREAICYLITLEQQQLRDMGVNLPELIDAAPGLAKYRSEDMEVHHDTGPRPAQNGAAIANHEGILIRATDHDLR